MTSFLPYSDDIVKVPFAHICDYASVSREGKLSAMGIFDRINVASLPAMHPFLYLAFELEIVAAELGSQFKLGIKLVDEDGNKVVETEAMGKIDATAPAGGILHAPQLIAFGGLPLPRAGRYSFDIFVNGDHKKSAPFEVAMATGTATGEAGGLRPG
jgi:hypothetical protein